MHALTRPPPCAMSARERADGQPVSALPMFFVLAPHLIQSVATLSPKSMSEHPAYEPSPELSDLSESDSEAEGAVADERGYKPGASAPVVTESLALTAGVSYEARTLAHMQDPDFVEDSDSSDGDEQVKKRGHGQHSES